MEVLTRESAGTRINIEYFRHGYEMHLDELASALATDSKRGLSEKEAKSRRSNFGENRIITEKPSVLKLYLAPLMDTLIAIYLLMTLVMIILAFWVDDIFSKISFWLVMIFFNLLLAIFQQFRAQKKLDALQRLSPPKTRVVRDNLVKSIFASELVPGDVVDLETGDKIPADCRLIEANNLTVNEASLTGESIPVLKDTKNGEGIDKDLPISEHSNFVYLGTFIQRGNGKAMVVRTGNETELGRIASAMGEMNTLDIPLRRKVNSLGKKLSVMMLAFLTVKIIQVVYIELQTGFSWLRFADDLSDAIITAMSVIPINIPLLTTVVLLSGVLTMAQNRVVVKNLAIIETLGRCSVLCSDKTGTMTTSQMTVKLIYDTNNYYGVELDEEYNNLITFMPQSELNNFLRNNHPNYPSFEYIREGSPLELLLTSAVLNNDANLVRQDTSDGSLRYVTIGDTTDGALLQLALAQGFNEIDIKKRYEREKHYPFDSNLKRMSGLYRDHEENDWMILTKGATEVILPRCDMIGDETSTVPLTEEKREEILDMVNFFAENGYRVISLAYRSILDFPQFETQDEERDHFELGLTYIGFAVIFDPPRPGVKAAVADLDSASVFPIMITGDSIATAATIGRQVGILDDDELVVEGKEASDLPDEEFFRVSVFARVSPAEKEIIVRRYQKRGDIVAMTGDGVNDALAITRSDAGVAMGITGTDVTKEAADIIITDDSYVSLVRGVEEGRNLFEKIRIMILFYLAVNIAEAILYFSASFIHDFELISQWQRIFIFTIVHAFPVLGIIFGPPDRDI
ncbi:MAG: cation-translocating P-type ATPase, partial [Candidatus Kariarchaeaceae archaeon]